MSEAKHTPGPHEFVGDGIWAKSPWNARVKLATITFPSPMNGIDGHANGHLFAAAAELLAAAIACLDYAGLDGFLDADIHPNEVWAIRREHLLKLRAAIAKATGAA
jgi:hypothetical protein